MNRSPRRATTFALALVFALIVPILAACGGAAAPTTSTAPSVAASTPAASTPAASTPAASVAASEAASESAEPSASTEASAPAGGAPAPAESPINTKTLVLGFNQAPETLFSTEVSAAITSQSVAPLGDCLTQLDYNFQPTYCYKEFPTFENGGAVTETVQVDPASISEENPIFVNGVLVTDTAAAEEAGVTIPEETFQMTVKFQIAQDLYWEDGQQVTAADAVESFRVLKEPELQLPSTIFRDSLKSVEAEGDFTVVETFQPGYIDSTYFTNFIGFVPQHVYGGKTIAEIRDQESVRPFSFGPYMVQEYVPGDSLTLVNNPYFATPPKVGTVVFKYVADSDQLLAQLESGEIDYAGTIGLTLQQAEQLGELESAGTIKTQFVPAAVWEHLDFSTQRPDGSKGPFADVRVRQAMAYAINRQQIIDNVLFGRTTTMNTYVASDHPSYPGDDQLEPYAYNPDKARQLLQEAGFSQAAPFQLFTTAGNRQRQAAAEIIQQNLKDVGVQVELQFVDAGTVLFAEGENGTLSSRNFDIALYAWVTGTDPSHELYFCDNIPTPQNGFQGQNYPAYCNPEFDQAGKAANNEIDRTAKKELDKVAEKIFNRDLPALPLYQRVNIGAFKPNVTGIAVNPTDVVDLWNIQDVDITE